MGRSLAVVLGGAALIACSTSKVPTERFAAAEATARAAQESGATKVPAAAFYLQLAEDEIGQARQLAADGKNDLAYNMLVRAESDGDLALAVAREGTARTQAQDAIRRAQQMRQALP